MFWQDLHSSDNAVLSKSQPTIFQRSPEEKLSPEHEQMIISMCQQRNWK